MVREVIGAFGSFNRLSEALEELCSEGIAPDSVRVAIACAPRSSALRRRVENKPSSSNA
jgi:hypothetical protein